MYRAILPALAVVSACGRPPTVPGPALESRLRLEVGDLVWNPAGPFPQAAGVAVLRHLGGAPPVRVSPIGPEAPARCPPVRLEPGGNVEVPVVVGARDATRLSLFAEYEPGAPVHGTTVLLHEVDNACDESRDWVARMRELVADGRLPAVFYRGYRSCPVGVAVDHAAPFVGERVPGTDWTEIRACGDFRAQIDETSWTDAESAELFVAAESGERMMLWMRLQGAVPTRPSEHLQYAFALETNGDPEDDYRPAPDFARDAFSGTDRWYELLRRPVRGKAGGGWRLRVTDARSGRFEAMASGARALVLGDLIVLAVPAAELGSATGFRASAFSHGGDFGLRPPHRWSGDREPPLAEGLHPPTR